MSDIYCKSCAYYVPGKGTKAGTVRAKCLHPKNADLVHGGPRRTPEELRYGEWADLCGLSGKWFLRTTEVCK